MPSFSNSPSADTGHSPHTQIIGKPPVVQHAYLHRDSITNSRLKGSPSVRSTNHSACEDGDSSTPHAACVAAELSHFLHTNKLCKIAHLMPPGSRENAGLPTLIIYFLHLNVFRNNFLPLHWSDALPLTLFWPFYGSEQGHMAVSALRTCRLLSDFSHLYSDVSVNQVCQGVRPHG